MKNMRRHFWLILAIVSLLGMIIMPGMAKSAVIGIPLDLPTIDVPRFVLPNCPLSPASLSGPRTGLTAPQLQLELSPALLSAPQVATVNLVANPAAAAPALIAVPKDIILASKIEGIAVDHNNEKGARSTLLSTMKENKEGRLSSPAKLAALFDGTGKAEPAPMQVAPPPASQEEDMEADAEGVHLTLPESDLAEEIGIGY
jgi:hypothetical protein